MLTDQESCEPSNQESERITGEKCCFRSRAQGPAETTGAGGTEMSENRSGGQREQAARAASEPCREPVHHWLQGKEGGQLSSSI